MVAPKRVFSGLLRDAPKPIPLPKCRIIRHILGRLYAQLTERESTKQMKIGDKNVVFQQTLLIPDNTDASFDVKIGNVAPVPFVVRFKPEMSQPQDKPQVRWQNEGRTVKIEFEGWTNPLGSTFAETQKLGTITGIGDLFLSVYHLRVGTVNHLDFQLLIQGG